MACVVIRDVEGVSDLIRWEEGGGGDGRREAGRENIVVVYHICSAITNLFLWLVSWHGMRGTGISPVPGSEGVPPNMARLST